MKIDLGQIQSAFQFAVEGPQRCSRIRRVQSAPFDHNAGGLHAFDSLERAMESRKVMDRLHALEQVVFKKIHPDFELNEDEVQCYFSVYVFSQCNLDSLRRLGIALSELIGKRQKMVLNMTSDEGGVRPQSKIDGIVFDVDIQTLSHAIAQAWSCELIPRRVNAKEIYSTCTYEGDCVFHRVIGEIKHFWDWEIVMGQSENSLKFYMDHGKVMVGTPQRNWLHDKNFVFNMCVAMSEDNVYLHDKKCSSFLKRVRYLPKS